MTQATVPKPPLPSSGGSYLRNPDGALKRVAAAPASPPTKMAKVEVASKPDPKPDAVEKET